MPSVRYPTSPELMTLYVKYSANQLFLVKNFPFEIGNFYSEALYFRDSFMIQAEDILRYEVSKNNRNNGQTLTIDLAKDGYLLFDSTAVSKFPGFTVTIEFDDKLPISETMRGIIPREHNESTDDASVKSSIQIRRISINSSESTPQFKKVRDTVSQNLRKAPFFKGSSNVSNSQFASKGKINIFGISRLGRRPCRLTTNFHCIIFFVFLANCDRASSRNSPRLTKDRTSGIPKSD